MMTVHVPMWLIYTVAIAMYLFVTYMTAAGRAIEGAAHYERPITSIIKALCWPILLVVAVSKSLWEKPS